MLLPFRVAEGVVRAVWLGVRSILRVIHEILNPKVDRQNPIPSDTYWAALRKIHRMRKPVFMGSLWLRRFDVEYLGLALPTAPPVIASQSLMESDLDYISATRQERHHRRASARVASEASGMGWPLVDQFAWTFDKLPAYLTREIPFLANRGGEALVHWSPHAFSITMISPRWPSRSKV